MMSFGRFEKYVHPGIYNINMCVYEQIKVIDMRCSVEQNKQPLIFLTTDNVQIDIKTYTVSRIVDPYKAICKIQNWQRAIEALVSQTIKRLLSSMKIHEFLEKSPVFDQMVKNKMGNRSFIFGIEILDFGINGVTIEQKFIGPLSQATIAEKEKKCQYMVAEAQKECSAIQKNATDILDKDENAVHVQYLDFLTNITDKKYMNTNNRILIMPDAMLSVQSCHDLSVKLKSGNNKA